MKTPVLSWFSRVIIVVLASLIVSFLTIAATAAGIIPPEATAGLLAAIVVIFVVTRFERVDFGDGVHVTTACLLVAFFIFAGLFAGDDVRKTIYGSSFDQERAARLQSERVCSDIQPAAQGARAALCVAEALRKPGARLVISRSDSYLTIDETGMVDVSGKVSASVSGTISTRLASISGDSIPAFNRRLAVEGFSIQIAQGAMTVVALR